MPLRPTPDALRERAFAVLGEAVAGARVLDLFAGTGAVGLEALSRGAAAAVFVERHRAAVRLIEANCNTLEAAPEVVRVIVRPVAVAVRYLGRQDERFQIIWADPPFESWTEGLAALELAASSGVLAYDGIALLECPSDAKVDSSLLEVFRDLPGGASRVVLMRVRDGGQRDPARPSSRHPDRASGASEWRDLPRDRGSSQSSRW